MSKELKTALKMNSDTLSPILLEILEMIAEELEELQRKENG